MYDDYEFNAFDLDYTCQYDLDESYTHVQQETYALDDDYARDSTDYQALAYMHYAQMHYSVNVHHNDVTYDGL